MKDKHLEHQQSYGDNCRHAIDSIANAMKELENYNCEMADIDKEKATQLLQFALYAVYTAIQIRY